MEPILASGDDLTAKQSTNYEPAESNLVPRIPKTELRVDASHADQRLQVQLRPSLNTIRSAR